MSVIPVLEENSGKKAGTDFGVCNNPEFLREGTAVMDFNSPSKTVIGELDQDSGDILAGLYAKLDAPLIRTDIETAEMIKYIDNSWHALKIGFANEIGNLCKSFSIDAHSAMEIFCLDRKLNISSAYLMPGFAFGGSCLPKDLRALAYSAKLHDLELPILNAILPSNELQVARGLQLIVEKGRKRIGILGFSFKAGTDDLAREPHDRNHRTPCREGLRCTHLRQKRASGETGRRESRFHPEPYSAYFQTHGGQYRRSFGTR